MSSTEIHHNLLHIADELPYDTLGAAATALAEAAHIMKVLAGTSQDDSCLTAQRELTRSYLEVAEPFDQLQAMHGLLSVYAEHELGIGPLTVTDMSLPPLQAHAANTVRTVNEAKLARQKAEIDAAPISAQWELQGGFADIKLELPHGNYFGAELENPQNPQGGSGMFFLSLHTEAPFRKRGIAHRLVSGLAYVALDKNAPRLIGSVESQHTIRAFRSVFGDDNLGYGDFDPKTGADIDLPITTEQVLMSLERAEAFEENPEHRKLGFATFISLDGLEKSHLEKPNYEG